LAGGIMSVSETAFYMESLLYSITETNDNDEEIQVINKVYQGDLDEPPMPGKVVCTIQAGKQGNPLNFPSISKIQGPYDVPFYIHGYVAGSKQETMLRMYDIADMVKAAFIADMDGFNNTCTSSHLPEDFLLYGEDSSGKGLYVGFQFIINCNYSNNE
jgi:hypothetical protein